MLHKIIRNRLTLESVYFHVYFMYFHLNECCLSECKLHVEYMQWLSVNHFDTVCDIFHTASDLQKSYAVLEYFKNNLKELRGFLNLWWNQGECSVFQQTPLTHLRMQAIKNIVVACEETWSGQDHMGAYRCFYYHKTVLSGQGEPDHVFQLRFRMFYFCILVKSENRLLYCRLLEYSVVQYHLEHGLCFLGCVKSLCVLEKCF